MLTSSFNQAYPWLRGSMASGEQWIFLSIQQMTVGVVVLHVPMNFHSTSNQQLEGLPLDSWPSDGLGMSILSG